MKGSLVAAIVGLGGGIAALTMLGGRQRFRARVTYAQRVRHRLLPGVW